MWHEERLGSITIQISTFFSLDTVLCMSVHQGRGYYGSARSSVFLILWSYIVNILDLKNIPSYTFSFCPTMTYLTILLFGIHTICLWILYFFRREKIAAWFCNPHLITNLHILYIFTFAFTWHIFVCCIFIL